MSFCNNLTPLPLDAPFALFQRLAESNRLFFYDDHIQILAITLSSIPDRPGYFALCLNRDSQTVTANYYKFLGRAFLTHPENLTRFLDGHDLTEPELDRIAYLKRHWVIPMVPAGSMHPAVRDRLDEIEELLEANMPSICEI